MLMFYQINNILSAIIEQTTTIILYPLFAYILFIILFTQSWIYCLYNISVFCTLIVFTTVWFILLDYCDSTDTSGFLRLAPFGVCWIRSSVELRTQLSLSRQIVLCSTLTLFESLFILSTLGV